jgi:hypothetical protein
VTNWQINSSLEPCFRCLISRRNLRRRDVIISLELSSSRALERRESKLIPVHHRASPLLCISNAKDFRPTRTRVKRASKRFHHLIGGKCRGVDCTSTPSLTIFNWSKRACQRSQIGLKKCSQRAEWPRHWTCSTATKLCVTVGFKKASTLYTSCRSSTVSGLRAYISPLLFRRQPFRTSTQITKWEVNEEFQFHE